MQTFIDSIPMAREKLIEQEGHIFLSQSASTESQVDEKEIYLDNQESVR